jgi:predicted AAA+ superfamily ATPase
MPHERIRHCRPLLLKELKFWPAVCLTGSRQVGKSTLLRNLDGFEYITFDNAGSMRLAEQNPSQFLSPPCIIDEAQKVPAVFDAIKEDIDKKKRPGKYILTGSVRFSKRTLIRESLAGRAKTIQMYPLTCSEALNLSFENRWQRPPTKVRVTRSEFQKQLQRGGMPAVFAARSQVEITSYWQSLTDSYVYRDLLLAVPKAPKPKLALGTLKAIAEILALGDLPTFSRILRKVGGTRGALERHIVGLEDMMLLHRIPHLKASRTKDILMPFDSALFLSLLGLDSASHDSAVHSSCVYIKLINEVLANSQYQDHAPELSYAVSPKGEVIHLITKDSKRQLSFWKIFEEPIPHHYSIRYLEKIAAKFSGITYGLTSIQKPAMLNEIKILPWESVL